MITSWLECCDLASDSRSVVSDSLQPHGLYTPWNSPGENAGVGSFSVLQGIFPTQGLNPGLPHCRKILYQLSYKGPRQCVKKQRRYFANKVHIVKAMVFLVVMCGCESWTIKKAECQRIDAFKLCCWKRLLKVCWTARSNQSILREINPWIFTGRTDAEAEAPVFWSSDVNRWLIGKVPDAGKEWGQKEKRASEDRMAGQHHQCNKHEVGPTPGDCEGQGSLVCCSPWSHKELDVSEWLNNNSSKGRPPSRLIWRVDYVRIEALLYFWDVN